ncbi:hypothetical protein ZEAMMB73_Zm00001d043931 [Zea mays]|uniref:Uncharacterized protein n=2 Tax=Zea mays TaxID=4577 RepID=A0A1D6NGB9_MAIZE|nr:hypothetical protein ZEAMMB73_Zm00001d043931 [Zea mays]
MAASSGATAPELRSMRKRRRAKRRRGGVEQTEGCGWGAATLTNADPFMTGASGCDGLELYPETGPLDLAVHASPLHDNLSAGLFELNGPGSPQSTLVSGSGDITGGDMLKKMHSQVDIVADFADGLSGQHSNGFDGLEMRSGTGPLDLDIHVPPQHNAMCAGLLELSGADFHDCFDSSQKFRNAYNDKVVKRKFIKQDFLGNTYNGACVGKYDRNSCRKRNADHFGGEKTRKNDTNKDRSKRLRCPLEQDQRQQVECNEMRNDSREGNVEMTRLVCQDGAKRNFNQKKNATAPASSDSTKCDGKNILSPKCSKTIASSHTPNLSEGSNDMDPKSDNYVDGCTERGILQHIPVTHTERNIQLKISDNFTQSEAFRRDCLILWRERQLRKDSAAKADNIVKPDQQQTAQRSKMSTGRRVGSGGSAASSCSKSDNKYDSAPECSDQFSGATSSDKLQKFGGRANKKLEQTIKFPSNSKCNKRPQDATAEKVLKCSLKLLSEADPLEIAQPKGKEKLVDRRQVSTEHQDAKAHSSLNGCSDTCKVDQAAISHCHNSAHQNISQQEKNSVVSDARREEKPGVKCEKKAAGHGAKLAEQSTGLYSDPISLDKETVVSCSKHGTSKVNALKVPDHEIGSTSLDGSMLPRGTVDMFLRKSINRSSESGSGVFTHLLLLYQDPRRHRLTCNNMIA